ncbi:MAG: Ig-like domain-containing protein, partial [Candidatus Diapherotrites archaeon]|nr:Ig-like domain-containing protein [Candidatus Diapherotrites archaeon]
MLSSGDGTKTVYVWIQDAAGNVSSPGSDTIILDTTKPTLSEVTPVTSPTNDKTPDYTFYSSEAGTITYSGGCASSTTTAIAGNNTITFNELTDGTYNCTITVTDASGNTSDPLNISQFTVDTTLTDTPTITIAGGANYTNTQNVSIEIGNDSEAVKWCVKESPTTPLPSDTCFVSTEPTSFMLSSGDGTKTVYVWIQDAAGNVSS